MQGFSLKGSLLANQQQQRPSRVGSKQISAPTLRRSTRRHRVARPLCYGSFENASLDIPRAVALVGQLASAAAWITAAFLGYKLVLEQDASQRTEKECETCNGTGVVPCICVRWSDAAGDKTGCGACGGTRFMSCSKCGGGGTAVPIEARVYIKQERDYY